MAEQINTNETKFPEGLISSRQIGYIDAENFPWLETGDQEQQKTAVNVSELDFGNGQKIYLASAIPKKLQKITETARRIGPKSTEESPYEGVDRLTLRACSIEAAEQSSSSSSVKGVSGGLSADYKGFHLRYFSESNKPNTRRMYYAFSDLSAFPIDPTTEDKPTSGKLIICLGWTDKQNQVKTLKVLTGQSHQRIVGMGGGD